MSQPTCRFLVSLLNEGMPQVQIYKWKRQLLDRAAAAFVDGPRTEEEAGPSRDELLKKIGELTVERDFLSNGLERVR